MKEKFEVSVERIRHSGMLVLSAMVGDELVQSRYVGYTKREAIQLFKHEIRELIAELEDVK